MSFYTAAMLGMGVSSVLRLASSANNCEDGAVKEKIIQNLVLRLKSQLNGDNNAKKAASIIYLITKLLYCGNIALQLSLIHIFLDTKYRLFGVELIRDLISGTDWQESGVFPRVTLCDFTVRQLANIQR